MPFCWWLRPDSGFRHFACNKSRKSRGRSQGLVGDRTDERRYGRPDRPSHIFSIFVGIPGKYKEVGYTATDASKRLKRPSIREKFVHLGSANAAQPVRDQVPETFTEAQNVFNFPTSKRSQQSTKWL